MQAKYSLEVDAYHGLHLRLPEAPLDLPEFRLFLEEQEAGEKYRAVWVYLRTEHLALLDALVNQLGYLIHHALGRDIVVYKWLRKEVDLVVPYSMFWVAAGALVIRDNKVLLVQEKSGKRKGKYGLPGGRANRGELIGQCAQRELLEETGVKATFEKVVYFRELTGQIYNCVDLYYVCLMTLEEEPLPQLQVCEREISSYQWVGLDDYEQFCLAHSFGTQVLVSKHVSKLYREGRLFDKGGYEKSYNLEKSLCEHRL